MRMSALIICGGVDCGANRCHKQNKEKRLVIPLLRSRRVRDQCFFFAKMLFSVKNSIDPKTKQSKIPKAGEIAALSILPITPKKPMKQTALKPVFSILMATELVKNATIAQSREMNLSPMCVAGMFIWALLSEWILSYS